MKKNTLRRYLLLILAFIIVLAAFYCIWYPISYYYAWMRLKLAYVMLNLIGIYPRFENIGITSQQGELFSFLPYLTLMIVTYGKKTVARWKEISLTFIAILTIEVLGRFFEKLVSYHPENFTLQTISIFCLGTARVAIPFLAWFLSVYKSKTLFFENAEPE
ncbi:MAG: hypothetical protein KAH01_03780 [Caldisericia bacterium]|nr:hypothetical protein [Caldisericia bacterium]